MLTRIVKHGTLIFTWLGIFAAIVAVTSFILHALGVAYQNQYWSLWNIERSLYPKPIEYLLIQGLESLLSGFVNPFFRAQSNNVNLIVGAVVVIITLLLFNHWLNDRRNRATKPVRTKPERLPLKTKKRLLKIELWFGRFFRGVLIAVTPTLIVPLVLAILLGLLLSPFLVIEEHVTSIVKDQRNDFALGCDRVAERKPVCADLLLNNVCVASGFILDSSDKHVSLFDVNLATVRTLERNALEIRPRTPSSPCIQNRKAVGMITLYFAKTIAVEAMMVLSLHQSNRAII